MQTPIPLGPFDLHRRIGAGGMGEVWAGHHRAQGVPVAVKVITASRARSEPYRVAFRDEVRAVAGLDHPGIVTVFDQGEVSGTAAAVSDGALAEGSPYLAMELAEGSLADRRGPRSWIEARGMLIALLDALGHAHARGVVHRDIKPGNVLLFPGDRGEVPRLTDFGLAHATERGDVRDSGMVGTPTYMAPEQFRGQWRDFGPWTDLYALGVLGWQLVSGFVPFDGAVPQIRQGHLAHDPPPLEPRFHVPPGAERWLLRLLEKDWQDRFQRAADATFALHTLGEADPDAIVAAATWPRTRATATMSDLEDGDTDEFPVQTTEELPKPDGCPRRLPPLPAGAGADLPRKPMRLLGAGLGLYGLRSIPLVDRTIERQAVWEALADVRGSGGTRAMVLQGTAGVGKSRLAEWIAQRADEAGNAIVLRAAWDEAGGAWSGLERMVTRALRCQGLGRDEALQRVTEALRRQGVTDEYEWFALAEILHPSVDGRARGVRFGSARERYAVLERMFARLAAVGDPERLRPVVLWLDDVQWGAEGLGFVSWLLGRGADALVGVLVILTAREEALADRPVERDLLAKLALTTVAIPPLAAADRDALVGELLGLEGDLAAQVALRTGGNPLFAVQLVGDWVQRGVLEPGLTGFVLREGDQAIIPDDIHALWAERIARVLDGRPEARAALEIAAVLGAEVDAAEWRSACAVAGVPAPADLVGALVVRRLARQDDDGWAFAHGMLRESLERSAHDSGRWEALHDACATMLASRYVVVARRGVHDRLGRHLVEAGRLEEAVGPLLRGAAERRAASDHAAALVLLDLRESVLDRLGLPPGDERRGDGQVLRAELLIGQGQLDKARGVALAAVEIAREHGRSAVLVRALRQAAVAALKRGQLAEAGASIEEAGVVAAEAGDREERARCLLTLGDTERLRGELVAAREAYGVAAGLFEAIGDRRGHADVLFGLAATHLVAGDLAEAERALRSSLRHYEAVDSRFGEAACANNLGDLLRLRGESVAAEASYARAEALMRSLGSPEWLFPRLNRGLVLVERGEFAAAREALEAPLRVARDTRRQGLEGILHAAMLPCVASAGDVDAWDHHLAQARDLLGRTGVRDPDVARAFEQAAGLAAAAGWPDRAAAAAALARDQRPDRDQH